MAYVISAQISVKLQALHPNRRFSKPAAHAAVNLEFSLSGCCRLQQQVVQMQVVIGRATPDAVAGTLGWIFVA